MYGNAIPIPRAANTENVKPAPASVASAAPIAVPIKGAVQGLATNTASTPESAEARYLFLPVPPSLPPAKPAPISNIPAKLSPIAKNSSAIDDENAGF